jgi:hypothetical protein
MSMFDENPRAADPTRVGKGIGFTVTDTYDDGGEGLSVATLSFGRSEVMFNSGG